MLDHLSTARKAFDHIAATLAAGIYCVGAAALW
jgi:hypothetical protein